ncbi:MAG: class D beta-lactamase [Magnetococcales bacterium]|nr:class D beta-lactamase [Magnetococcales bacterium]
MQHRLWLFFLGLFLALSPCRAEVVPEPVLADILRQAGMEGSIVLTETGSQTLRVSDEVASGKRYLPASTFKVVNALIALENGLVQEEERFPWDGAPLPFKTWEKELSLQEAMAVSSVPVFQGIARRIGLQRMQEWVGKLDYGNGEIGTVVDRFWLDGPLVLSAQEAARFMARVAEGQLPFSPATFAAVRRILPKEEIGEARLFGKTGWAMSAKPMIGWYVGWVENRDKKVAFAVNIRMKSPEEAPLRKSLALEALRRLGMVETK